jgi:hypothetical protein
MSEYEMPKAELGEWVLFYVHENADPVPALVTQVSSRTLHLWAVAPNYGGVDKTSVHHVTDPGVHEFPEWKRYGYWEHKAKDPTISILSERVAALERKLNPKKP